MFIDGLDGARARAATIEDASTWEAFHAVFEALAWVGAIRDRLGRHETTLRTLNGLYYVRNLVLHEGAEVLAWEPTTYGTGTYGSGRYGGTRVWKWPSRDELPSRRRDVAVDADYDEHVAGREVPVVLAAVVEELRRLPS